MDKPEYCTRVTMRFLRNCGYDGVRLHGLRATAATILASKGVPIKNVQFYLGHKDVQTILNYYVHILDADKIATATVMGNVFAGAVSPACSGSCSGTANEAADNVIPFQSIAPKKLAEI